MTRYDGPPLKERQKLLRAYYTAQKPKVLAARRGKRDELSPPPREFRVAKRLRACKQVTAHELHLPLPQSDQAGCLLLNRLPAEIRLQIWQLVIGGQEIHILRKEKKLGHQVCPGNEVCLHSRYLWRVFNPGENYRREPFIANDKLAERSLLPLIMSCRQIYSEAIDLLYTTNAFDIPNIWALDAFRFTTLSKRFLSIRRLSLHYMFAIQATYPSHKTTWESTMRILKSMTSLRELHFTVSGFSVYRGQPNSVYEGPGIFRPFLPLKNLSQGLDKFVIDISKVSWRNIYDVGAMEKEFKAQGVKCEIVLGTG